MKKLTDFSLKWRIYWFYLLLGFIPLLVVSYFSVQAYTRSIVSITDRHVSQLVQQIAEQTHMRCRHVWQDLERMAQLPYIRRYFHEYRNTLRIDLTREKLEQTRRQVGYINALALYSNQGDLLVRTAAPGSAAADALFVEKMLETNGGEEVFYRLYGGEANWQMVIFTRVYAYQDPLRPVGYLIGNVSLAYAVAFLERLDISPGTAKTIYAETGEPLYVQKAHTPSPSGGQRLRTFTAIIDHMNWRIDVRIPEAELFADVHSLLLRTFSFTAVVVILAGAASLLFSRRFMRPFDTILGGTRAFAQGDLDHRIAIQKGQEAKRLAQAFNDMAGKLKVRQMELIQSNKLASLGLMAAGIAHEIKNPLAGIKTSAQVIDGLVSAASVDAAAEAAETASAVPASSRDDIHDLSQGVVSEVNRLTKIVQDLLEFGRPGPSRKQNCRVDRIVDRAVSLVQKEIKKKQATVDNQLPPFTAEIDPDQMLQVFINLMLNAIATVDSVSGRISIRLNPTEDGGYRVAVEDNGQGIAEDKLAHIFDPFFSLTQNGTGLGLSVVYTLLQQNAIKVDVTSRLNEGTTFFLTFAGGAVASGEKADG